MSEKTKIPENGENESSEILPNASICKGESFTKEEIEDYRRRESEAVDARLDEIRQLYFKATGMDMPDGNLFLAEKEKEANGERASAVQCEEGEEGIFLTIKREDVASFSQSPQNASDNSAFFDAGAYQQTQKNVPERNKSLQSGAERSALENLPQGNLLDIPPEREKPYEYGEPDEESDELSIPDDYGDVGLDTLSLYVKGELSKRIESFYKEENSLQRRIEKIAQRQKSVDAEGEITLIVEKIGVQKEICELTIETLSSCVYAGTKGKISRYKQILKGHIDRYNSYCEEYEAASGRPLRRLEYAMIEDIVAGKICPPIPNVYYYGMEDDAIYSPEDEENDRLRRLDIEQDLIEGEWKRYLDGTAPLLLSEEEKKALEKRNAEKMSAIKRAAERDVLLVGLRSEYALGVLEAKRDLLVRSYGLDKRKTLKSIRDIERKIDKINRNASRAVAEQRKENSRFYLLKALDPAAENLKSGARRERLDALRARLDILLAERESVNDRLIALYGGADNNLKKTKIVRKAAKIRRRSATAMYKKQRKLAKRIDRYRVPSDMKERAYDLLNQNTQAVATADECYYKLKRMKPVGRAKKELIGEIRRSNRKVRQLKREMRYMLRRLRRTQERYEDNKEWASVIAFAAAVILIGVFVWLVLGDSITAYFTKLISQLGGG